MRAIKSVYEATEPDSVIAAINNFHVLMTEFDEPNKYRN